MSGSSFPESLGLAPEVYRRLLSRFATGVTVVTALDARGRPRGMTASAVASVSLDPPIVLVCVDRAADLHPVLSRAARFALSVLASDQEPLSHRFADEHPDRFTGVAHRREPGGLPLLEGAVAHIVCDRWGAHEVGDHTVFFGLVTAGEACDRRPLLHFEGRYTTVADRR